MLQPSGELDGDDLEAAYAYPTDRTWTRLNFVTSLDGATLDLHGRCDGLSAPGDQRVFHLLRSLADVIVVGAGTARAEGYLPVRHDEVDTVVRERLGLAPLPPIAVVTHRLDLPDHLLARTGDLAPTLVVTSAAAVASAPADRLAAVRRRAEVLVCGDAVLDPQALRDELAARGLRRVLCEGGPALAGSLARGGMLDEVCLTVSPQLLAGDSHRIAAGPPLDPPLRLRLAHVIEDDHQLLLRYVRAEEP